MPQLQRFFCSNCQRAIDEVKIGSKLVPLVIYWVVGQVPDTGAPLDIGNESGVKLPSFIRELMQPHVPVARVEWCIPCLAEHLGLKMFTAEDDPMYSVEQTSLTKMTLEKAAASDPHATTVEQHHRTVERALLALKVGRGALKAPKLPPATKSPSLPMPRMPGGALPRPGHPTDVPRARKRAKAKPEVRHVAPPPDTN